ncbi:MAG: putative glycoside hydrolase [Spirochaetes bacterium]|nr:putative glycoside hydrolase [Spirochaetota bacterium]
MRIIVLPGVLFMLLFLFGSTTENIIVQKNPIQKDKNQVSNPNIIDNTYKYPEFYRGIYLNVYSARNLQKLSQFVEKGKKSNVNCIVMDIQRYGKDECLIPAENIKYLLDNNIHPVARIVAFQDGLTYYPVAESVIDIKIRLAEEACKLGFKEIQFDYIRFNDSPALKYLDKEKRFVFIENFLKTARNSLKKYNVRIAADIFGRIPLNSGDIIGQRMEGLDKVVDIICPMAYPSHYTWSKKMMADPYYTVLLTSKSAKERTKEAAIVAYIQAFKMKLSVTNLSYEKYIEEQLRAIHDSGIRGYILWNAAQKYDTPFDVMRDYYKKKTVKAEAVILKDKAS